MDTPEAPDGHSDPQPESAELDVLELLDAAVSALGGSPRPGQQKMASAVDRAIARGKHLAVQAGTGTGKSLAYLVPAAKHAVASGEPVVVSTATIALQRQLVKRDLPRLAEALEDDLPRTLTSAILKGRTNYLCLNKVRGAAEEALPDPQDSLIAASELSATGAQVKRLREWAEDTDTGDRDDLERGVSDMAWRQVSVSAQECIGKQSCPFGAECFAEKAREEAQGADIMVTNHALLAIDALADRAVLPEHSVTIIDEAHELESRITGVATAEISPAGMVILAKRINAVTNAAGLGAVGDELQEAADQWGQELQVQLNTQPVSGRWVAVPEPLQGPLEHLRDVAWSVRGELAGIPEQTFTDDAPKAAERRAMISALENLYDAIQRVRQVDRAGTSTPASDGDDGREDTDEPSRDSATDDVVWLSEDSKVVRVAPLSISELLAKELFSHGTVVLTSATLTLGGKFEAMMAQWGARSSSMTTLDVGTPFEARTHGILYTAAHLPRPGYGRTDPAVVDEVAQLINAAGGRTLGLFSSRRAAEDMAAALRSVVPYDILLQGEDSMSTLVERFRKDDGACLFGTLGLWQGVDVPGPSLSLVIIDRIPFPRPDDPLMQARQEAATAAGRNGFMEVAANHAALLMAQGAGRLLRATTDRGVVAVLDSRLVNARYGTYIRRSMPDFWPTTDPTTVRKALRRLRGAQ